MRFSVVAALLCVGLVAETVYAEPVALRYSATVILSHYQPWLDGSEFDWVTTLPNGSAVYGCLSYDADQAPTSVQPDRQYAAFNPLFGSEAVLDTVAGRFATASSGDVYGSAFTSPNHNGYTFWAQPISMPSGWTTSELASFGIQLFNDATASAPVTTLGLPADVSVTSFTHHELIIDFMGGVTTDIESTTRDIQVHASIDAGAWTPGSCSVLVPCNGSYASPGAYMAAVAKKAQSLVEQDVLTPEQRKELIANAAQSRCSG